MSTYELVADLPVHIESYRSRAWCRTCRATSRASPRSSTCRAAARRALGEDVVYDAVDHEIAQDAGPILPLAGDWTMRSFSEHLATLDPFAKEPQREVSRLYRTWAYESAALDLALRQAASRCTRCSGARRSR